MKKRIAITVKYHGPTNTLGSRVSYTCENFGMRKMVPYSYDHSNIFDQAVAQLPVTVTEYYETPKTYVVLVPQNSDTFLTLSDWFTGGTK